MKRLLITLVAILLVGGLFAQQSSSVAPPDHKPIFVGYEFFAGSRSDDCNFLVLRNNLPWSLNVTVPYLLSQGGTVTTANSTQFPAMDFNAFDVIIIESDQNEAFHTAFAANFAKFVDFVQNGGRLQVHAATGGHNSPSVSVSLPGGVVTSVRYESSNIVVNAAHPIVAGVTSPFQGNQASHGYFTNLYPDTDIITAEQNGGQPTTIQYTFGNGTVTATTCTYEWGYNYNQGAGIMFQNNLQYSCEFTPDPPLPSPIPVSNWVIYLGILLMIAFVLIRFRKMM